MICKDSVICWFRNLNCDERIEIMCLLLGCLNPFEVRFLGTYIEDLAKKDYSSLLRTEKEANLPATYLAYRNIHEKNGRSKLCVLLPLLRSDNRQSADALFEILTVHEFGCISENIRLDLCLLLTLSTNHPAFTFEQRLKMREKLKFLKESPSWPSQAVHQAEILENTSQNLPSSSKDALDDTLTSEHGASPVPVKNEGRKSSSPWKTKVEDERAEESVFIEDVRVVGSHVHFAGNKKEYTLEIKWSDERREKVSKSYDEICEFHHKLVQTFSEDSKNGNQLGIPSIPVDFIVKVSQTGEVKDKHLIEMEQFIRKLFLLPRHIVRSSLVSKFFQSDPEKSGEDGTSEQRPQSFIYQDGAGDFGDYIEDSSSGHSSVILKQPFRKFGATKPPPPVLPMYNPMMPSSPVQIPQEHHFGMRPTLTLPLPLRPILFSSSGSLPQLQTSPLSPRHLSVPPSPNTLFKPSSPSLSSPLQSPISSPLPSPILSPRGSPYASPFGSPRISPAHSPSFRRRSTGSMNYSTRNPPAWMSVYDWLKSLRLHKYSDLFRGMSFREMLKLSDENLQEMGMTIGATRKLRVNLEALRVRGFVGFNGFNVDSGSSSLGLDASVVHGLSLDIHKVSLSPTPSETDSAVVLSPCPNVTISMCDELKEEKRDSSSSVSDCDMQSEQSESGSQEGGLFEDDVFATSTCTSPFQKSSGPEGWSNLSDRERKDSPTSSGPVMNGYKVQCYNCGMYGHIGRQCEAPTMDSSRANVGFHLRYNPSSSENS